MNYKHYDLRLAAYGETLPQFVELALSRKMGIEVQDFSTPDKLDNNCNGRIKEITSSLKKLNGNISLHGPFMDLSAASPDPLIVEVTLLRLMQSLEICSALGGDTLVLHSCFNPMIKHPDYTDHWVERQKDFWQNFAMEAKKKKITIALENLFEENPSKSMELFSVVNADNFKACLDVGHVNLMSPLTPGKWGKMLGRNLHYVHFHSNNGKIDDHTSPGKGNMDFSEFFTALSEMPKKPVITVEVRNIEDAKTTIDFLRKNLC